MMVLGVVYDGYGSAFTSGLAVKGFNEDWPSWRQLDEHDFFDFLGFGATVGLGRNDRS